MCRKSGFCRMLHTVYIMSFQFISELVWNIPGHWTESGRSRLLEKGPSFHSRQQIKLKLFSPFQYGIRITEGKVFTQKNILKLVSIPRRIKYSYENVCINCKKFARWVCLHYTVVLEKSPSSIVFFASSYFLANLCYTSTDPCIVQKIFCIF